MINYALELLAFQKRIEACGGNLLHPHCRAMSKRRIFMDMASRIGAAPVNKWFSKESK